MAHSALHFSVGMIAGTAVALPALARAWREDGRLSPHFRRWMLWAYGLGALAIVPALLRKAGLPDAVCEGWWMNVFMLHSLINTVIRREAMPQTGALLALCFGCQYVLILLAIRRQRARR